LEPSVIAKKRGCSLNWFPTSMSFVLVKADIDSVSSVLAGSLSDLRREFTVVPDVYKNMQDVTSNFLVWQYTRHFWTIFRYGVCQESLPKSLSEKLSCDCIYFEHESVSGWTGYTLYRSGI
jgi:hypothetical protein